MIIIDNIFLLYFINLKLYKNLSIFFTLYNTLKNIQNSDFLLISIYILLFHFEATILI